ncbi:MAG: GTPase [Thermoguttaceae bacterium]|jgi:GTP-binding protein EngB required for normal cell division
MSSDFASFAAGLKRLDRALSALEPAAASIGLSAPRQDEWFQLLANKLLPQLDLPPLLVVAIIGGTNIGKSVIFNHLAGENASAATPLAAGTKHPVCLVPPDLCDPALLQRLFEPFQLHVWHSPDDPLSGGEENRLYWRPGPRMPQRLLLIDTPDVDSDVPVNWSRAKAVRQAADVLVAVLTQQKYNDAAVKQFFRAAAQADKPILVLFNQCDLKADADYWPQWLSTFRDQISAGVLPSPFSGEGQAATLPSPIGRGTQRVPGVEGVSAHVSITAEPQVLNPEPRTLNPEPCKADLKSALLTPPSDPSRGPELVYIVPYDRRAAEKLRLPFYCVGKDGTDPIGRPVDLRDELAALRFDAIKIRTFRGAMRRVLDPGTGLPAYLQRIRAAAGDFASAAKILSAQEMARVDWPMLPSGVLVEEIRAWWDAHREAWSRHIHGFYRVLGRGVTWPIRAAWSSMSGPNVDPLISFQQQERAAIVAAVGKLLDELDRLSQIGNDTLRPRLLKLLGGHARAELLARVQAAHEQLPAIDEHYREFLCGELDKWKQENARIVRYLQSFDHLAALARPAITIGLFFTGLHFAGDLAGQAAVHAAGHTASQIATEAAITGGITGGGEALVSTTSEGVSQAAARLFLRLQSRYAQQRAQWLAAWLESELLGGLLTELRQGAEVPQLPAFHEVEKFLGGLEIGN